MRDQGSDAAHRTPALGVPGVIPGEPVLVDGAGVVASESGGIPGGELAQCLGYLGRVAPGGDCLRQEGCCQRVGSTGHLVACRR